MSTEDEIFRLAYSFLHINEDLTSIRYFAEDTLALATTTDGKVIRTDFSQKTVQDELQTMDLRKVIDGTQNVLENEETSNARKLLGYGLMWLISDVYGLPEIWDGMLHPNAEMFGNKGKASIMAFKHDQLIGSESNNYRIDAILQIDGLNRVIVSDFDCLLEGKEGRGTELMKFDVNWKVIRVDALRH